MPERGRRIVSFALGVLAVFAVGRVLLAYATRPSRWTTRFALPALDDAGIGTPGFRATEDDFAVLSGIRASMMDAIERGDPRGYCRSFSPDAIVIPATGLAIAGKGAIEAAVCRTFEHARFVDARLAVSTRTALGENVFEEGDFHIQLRADDADVQSKGRFAALWKRELGEWRIVFEAVRADGNETVEA